MESYLRVNLFGPGPRLMKKKIIYRAAGSQILRNAGLEASPSFRPPHEALLTPRATQLHSHQFRRMIS